MYPLTKVPAPVIPVECGFFEKTRILCGVNTLFSVLLFSKNQKILSPPREIIIQQNNQYPCHPEAAGRRTPVPPIPPCCFREFSQDFFPERFVPNAAEQIDKNSSSEFPDTASGLLSSSDPSACGLRMTAAQVYSPSLE